MTDDDKTDPKKVPTEFLMNEVKNIIETQSGVVETEKLVQILTPYIAAIGMLRQFLTSTGFSNETAEEMALAVWHVWWPYPTYDDED